MAQHVVVAWRNRPSFFFLGGGRTNRGEGNDCFLFKNFLIQCQFNPFYLKWISEVFSPQNSSVPYCCLNVENIPISISCFGIFSSTLPLVWMFRIRSWEIRVPLKQRKPWNEIWRQKGPGWNSSGQCFLGGGFKYFLFSSLLGEMIQTD